MSYEVRITEWVVGFIEKNIWNERVYDRVSECMQLIGEYPEMAVQYDPVYPAARPPFPCRRLVVSGTPFALYYVADDEAEAEAVTVFYMEYLAGNPRTRSSET